MRIQKTSVKPIGIETQFIYLSENTTNKSKKYNGGEVIHGVINIPHKKENSCLQIELITPIWCTYLIRDLHRVLHIFNVPASP